MKKRILPILLILTMVFVTTSTAFASTGNLEGVSSTSIDSIKVTGENSFSVNDEEFYLIKNSTDTFEEVVVKNIKGEVISKAKKYNDTKEIVISEMGKTIVLKPIKVFNPDKDLLMMARSNSDYHFLTSYTYNLGYVTSSAGLVSAICLSVTGIGLAAATAIATEIISYGAQFVYIKEDVYQKTDDKYIYIMKKVYAYSDANCKNKIYGPETFKMKRPIDK